MIINNPNLTEVVNVLVIVAFAFGGFIAFFLLAMKVLYDKVHEINIKLQAMTPESRALARAYYEKLYREHQKEKDYDKRLDKMFEDEKKGANKYGRFNLSRNINR